MNVFHYLEGTGYVTFEGYYLNFLGTDGNLRWKRPFGIGSVPSRVFLSDSGIFVFPPASRESDRVSLVFGYTSSRLLGSFGFPAGERTVPLVAGPAGAPFSLRLADMRLLPQYGASAFPGPDRTGLLSVSADGRSVWSLRGSGRETVFIFSHKGNCWLNG